MLSTGVRGGSTEDRILQGWRLSSVDIDVSFRYTYSSCCLP